MIRRVKELVYHRFLLPTVERLPAKTAVIDGEFTASFAEHLDRVCQLINGMAAEVGVRRGTGSRSWPSTATSSSSSTTQLPGRRRDQPLNLRLAPQELAFILKDSGCGSVSPTPSSLP